MTKLLQWLFVLSIYGILYYAALANYLPIKLVGQNRLLVMASPVILVGLFGIYSVFVIIYRVATFNDCPEAAEELRKEIEEAKKDLTSRGLKFD